MRSRERVTIGAIFLAQVVCLAIAASRNLHALNPDAVAYLQVTRHLLHGEFALSVNGYWGPLISWLAVPVYAATDDPLLTARSIMVVSAVLFSFGSFVYLLRSRVPPAALSIGTAACALVTVYWSVSEITPDLLADGLFLIGFSGLSAPEWIGARLQHRRCGLFIGAAYLAKAVMLPVGIATILAISLHQWYRRRDREVARAAIRTLAFVFALALPWIAVLSVHYGRPTFSTAGPIAHALVGPPDADRRNPIILSFRHPRPGRLIDSEDPIGAAFPLWSPFASRRYAQWQLTILRENGVKIRRYIDSLTAFHIGLTALIAALLLAIVLPKRVDDAPALLAAIPLVAAVAIYLPVFADSRRYYIIAYPLMLGAAAGIGALMPRRSRLFATIATATVAIAIVLAARSDVRSAFATLPRRASAAAFDLASRMREKKMIGPIAGVGPIDGGMGGLYTAFFLEVPWCGDEPQPRLTTLRASGARYWIIGADDREKLKSIPPNATRDVTTELYGTQAATAPFVVREVIR